MIDLIVKEELNRIEENYGMNRWTLNVIYYTTAVTLLENEGNLREERRTQKPYKKPGWKIRHESRIQAIRKKISHTCVLIECNRKQKFSNNQKNYQMQDRKTIWESDNTQPQIYASYVKART